MKQRMQAKQYQSGLLRGIHQLYRTEGISGFYRGFKATIFREIPFVCIQFPLYERMLLMASKSNFNQSTEENQLKNWKTAGLCGAISSAITAALTTPLDVIKTRTMLLDLNKGEAANIDVRSAIRVLWLEGGLPRLFSGVVPRTLSIGAGGFIFFGAYQKTKNLLHPSFYFN